jgi:hypothetical protein
MDPAYIESLRQAYEAPLAFYDADPLADHQHRTVWTSSVIPQDLAYIEGRIRTALKCGGSSRAPWRRDQPKFPGLHRRPPQRTLVTEFLALTEAVGALGAALSADPTGSSEDFRRALALSRRCLERMESAPM